MVAILLTAIFDEYYNIPLAIDTGVFGGTITNAFTFDMLCGWALN